MIKRSPFPNCSPAFPGNAVATRSPVPLPIGNGNGNAPLRDTTRGQPFPSWSTVRPLFLVWPAVTRAALELLPGTAYRQVAGVSLSVLLDPTQPRDVFIYGRFLELIMTDSRWVSPCLS